jgi:hypothetical protein
MKRHRLRLLFATAAAPLVSGCGSTALNQGRSTESAAAIRSDHAMVEFARCMRTHGTDVPDPFHRPGHDGLSIDLPTPGPATSDAYGACGHYLEPAIELKQRVAEQRITPVTRLGLIRYAECMRGHAVAMLDPNRVGQLSLGSVPGISDGFGRYTPQFRLADRDCRHLLPPSVPDNGTGP